MTDGQTHDGSWRVSASHTVEKAACATLDTRGKDITEMNWMKTSCGVLVDVFEIIIIICVPVQGTSHCRRLSSAGTTLVYIVQWCTSVGLTHGRDASERQVT